MLRLRPVAAHLLTRLSAEHLGQLFPTAAGDDAAAAITTKIGLLQQQVDEARAMAAAAELEVAKALATEPALAAVLGRQVVMHEQRAIDLEREAEALRHQLAQLHTEEQTTAISDLSARVAGLLQQFADPGDDETKVADRTAVNGLLRRLGVRIVVDAANQQIGMAVGTGELQWQPLDAPASAMALQLGLSGTTYRREKDGRVAASIPLESAPEALVAELTDQAIAQVQRG